MSTFFTYLCMNGKTLFSCFQLSEDIHHPCLWDHHGDCHTERGENTNRLRVSVLKIKHFNQPAFMYSCVAAGACKNAAGFVPRGPSVSRSALFAHGDHQDIRQSRAQRGAPLQGRVYVTKDRLLQTLNGFLC